MEDMKTVLARQLVLAERTIESLRNENAMLRENLQIASNESTTFQNALSGVIQNLEQKEEEEIKNFCDLYDPDEITTKCQETKIATVQEAIQTVKQIVEESGLELTRDDTTESTESDGDYWLGGSDGD